MSDEQFRRTLALLGAGIFIFCASRVVATEEKSLAEIRRGPFIIRADFNLAAIENELAALDALVDDMSTTLRLPKFREKIVVRVFRDEAAWRNFHRNNLGGAPYRRAMYDRKNSFFDRDDSPGRAYLYLNPKFEYDLRRECARAVLGASLGRSVPIWLDEGIAVYFEAAPEERLANPVWRAKTVERLQRSEFSSLESLEKSAEIGGMTNAKCCDSWAWVCWFLNGPNSVRDTLPQYLSDIASQKLFVAKPSKRLAKIANEVAAERSLRRFFKAEEPITENDYIDAPRSSGLKYGVDHISGGNGGWIPAPTR